MFSFRDDLLPMATTEASVFIFSEVSCVFRVGFGSSQSCGSFGFFLVTLWSTLPTMMALCLCDLIPPSERPVGHWYWAEKEEPFYETSFDWHYLQGQYGGVAGTVGDRVKQHPTTLFVLTSTFVKHCSNSQEGGLV